MKIVTMFSLSNYYSSALIFLTKIIVNWESNTKIGAEIDNLLVNMAD